jgi:hypothetical protein
MNRRQVLFGAGATAMVFGGFVPWANAGGVGAASPSAMFPPFSMGIRGTYTLHGTAMLIGMIPSADGSSGSSAVLDLRGTIVQGSAAPTPAVATPVPQEPAATQAIAPARPPMMSIVRVPRGSKVRAEQVID